MSNIIKIPSSFIFGVESLNTKSNRIKSVSNSIDNYTLKNGNVTKNPRSFRMYSRGDKKSSSSEYYNFTYEGNGSKNDVSFSLNTGNGTSTADHYSTNGAPIYFDSLLLDTLSIDGVGNVTNIYPLVSLRLMNSVGLDLGDYDYDSFGGQYVKKCILKYDFNSKKLYIPTEGLQFRTRQYVEGQNYAYTTSLSIYLSGNYLERESVTQILGDDNAGITFKMPSSSFSNNVSTHLSENLATYLSRLVKESYSFGKKVYRLKCSLGEYYTIDGTLAKSIKSTDYQAIALFENNERVIPYIHTVNGEEPLSMNGAEATVFKVVGVDFEYTGVPWQYLTIQEI